MSSDKPRLRLSTIEIHIVKNMVVGIIILQFFQILPQKTSEVPSNLLAKPRPHRAHIQRHPFTWPLHGTAVQSCVHTAAAYET